MSFYGASTEYVLHSLLWLVDNPEPVSSLDLAELQNIPAAFVAKLLPKLEKAGLLNAAEGLKGGYTLAKPADEITVLAIVDAVDGEKRLFNCQEIRGRCALFDENPPGWATQGVCGIHAVMLRAEKAMRRELAQTSLADLAKSVRDKAPSPFLGEAQTWLDERVQTRRTNKVRQRRRSDSA
ncbi:Rrf2 family transcriptional regulator [Gluconobacter cerinus]|uniref:Transcriptional regulator n=1 Tax=Gluconobacter cerinus TaxID=38307 RepID=A0AAV5NAT5_9PROT|nr:MULTISPECIES: Rrf2 family transcriptional regulator [Gluconobacter]MBS1024383.1 Rrf2 family transcriptional regulator [Gluconobacter cerinus]MBS1032093.1 Rrf2 family transcriptional regulator [Gluconobacter cerinus]MBS1039211.1 Rrf2 family transcriptional regulator [Gluconobacter cerinus]MBS1041075.1 Rrf2 family transcriptional regulator [Gluconobacter cerinus]MBS1044022.1 Rrf2 family transcriptional regulator [Gluconobacter cerinus]